MKSFSTAAALFIGLICATPAGAVEAMTSETPVVAPVSDIPVASTAIPMERRALIGGNRFSSGLLSTGGSPFIVGALQLDPGLLLSVGFALQYNGNGLAPTALAIGDTVSSQLMLDVQYMVCNTQTIAMGPELMFTTDLAPTAGNIIVLRPGWAMWFMPWHAPVSLGFSWNVDISIPKSPLKPLVNLGTGSLRLLYTW